LVRSRSEKHISPVVTFANLNRSVPFYGSMCLTQLESCITGSSTFIATRHVGCAAHIKQHLPLFARNVCAHVPGVSQGHQRFRAHLFHVLDGFFKEITAAELENGPRCFIGDGKGKRRLTVSSDEPVTVQSLLETPAGFITNLSASAQ
jgi:hypothetical protein